MKATKKPVTFELTYTVEEDTSFVERLMQERKELKERALKLYDVIFTKDETGEQTHNLEFKSKVGEDQYRLLCAQYYTMASYAEILTLRLELLDC